MATRCKFRGRRGNFWHVLKIDGSLARNIDFEVANFRVLRKTRRKTSILKLQSVKIGGSLVRNARFGAPTCLVSRLWFSRGLAVSMGEAAKLVFLSWCQLWKLPEVSYEMLVFLHPRVSSGVAGCPVASPCLWGKPQNLSFSNVSTQVVMSFCVAGVALCDIPTCLITGGKYQNWRKSRTKCWFFNGFSASTCLSRVAGCPVALPCLWGKLENLTFSNVPKQVVILFTLYTLHSSLHIPHFTLHTPLHSSLHTPHFTLHTFHFTILTLHSALHTPHFPLHTFHSTLHTKHFTLHTPHFTLVGGGVVTLVVRVVMFYWLGFVRFRLCSASRYWSTYMDEQ